MSVIKNNMDNSINIINKCSSQLANRLRMKFKPGNRWKNSKNKIRYKKWRTSVFQLNKGKKGLSKYYVCEKCDKKRKTTRTLHAHHIYSWDKFPDKRYTMKNGVVLCIKCHNAFHRKYRFEALDKPNLLLEYLGDNKAVKDYIKE